MICLSASAPYRRENGFTLSYSMQDAVCLLFCYSIYLSAINVSISPTSEDTKPQDIFLAVSESSSALSGLISIGRVVPRYSKNFVVIIP